MWDKFVVEVNVYKPVFDPFEKLQKAENLNINTHGIKPFSVVSVEL